MDAITIGLDIAKSVFQVHGEDASGKVVFQKRLRRTQVEPFFAKLAPEMVGLEACGSAQRRHKNSLQLQTGGRPYTTPLFVIHPNE